MTNSRYSSVQKLCFFGALIALVGCICMAATPHWKEADINVGDVDIPFFGGLELLKYEGGLFYFCVENSITERECFKYDLDEGNGADNSGVVVYAVASLVGIVTMIVLSIRMCCGSGGRTVVWGIIMLGVGACYAITIVCFSSNREKSWAEDLMNVEYEYAYYCFIVGTCVIGVSAIGLITSHPETTFTGMIQRFSPGPSVVVANSSSMMTSNSALPYQVLHNDPHRHPVYQPTPTPGMAGMSMNNVVTVA